MAADVIVGAGAAGSVLANRLTERAFLLAGLAALLLGWVPLARELLGPLLSKRRSCWRTGIVMSSPSSTRCADAWAYWCTRTTAGKTLRD